MCAKKQKNVRNITNKSINKMAALQKVRNAGPLVVGALFIGLIGFIASDWTRVVETFFVSSHNTVGEINGKDIDVQEFNELVDEYANVIKTSNGLTNLDEKQMQSVRDQVWQTLVQQEIINGEAEKLGLTVTDQELQQILVKGEHPMLQQTPFVNQGKFDYNLLKSTIAQYKEILTDPNASADWAAEAKSALMWWEFIEKTLRNKLLAEKYQSLIIASAISNPIEAEQNFNARNTDKTLLMAALPFSSIKDSEITVEDKDLKAKYNELKTLFETSVETRSINYIDVAVTASEADEAELNAQMNEYAQQLIDGASPAKVVRESRSLVPYSTLPISAKALPTDIANKVDTMKADQQVGPYYNAADNTMNIIRLLSVQTLPDSVEFRVIGLPAADMAKAEASADSIMRAIQAGAPFDTIAKKYNNNGEKQWMTSSQYEGMAIDDFNKKFIEAVTTTPAGTLKKLALDNQSVFVINVLQTANPIKKYDVAVVKNKLDFSKQTYDKAFSNFSSFLAGKNAGQIDTLAMRSGYRILSDTEVYSTDFTIGGVNGTRDALRWIFNEDTKVGDVSQLYECGDNNHLMCIILTGITPKGYLSWDNEDVKNYLKGEVIKDKKIALLQAKLANAKSIAEVAKIEGVVTDTLRSVNFASPVFVSKTGFSEPAISGSSSKQDKGAFKNNVAGNGAVYAYEVLASNKKDEKFDQKQEQGILSQKALRSISYFSNELYRKAKIKDNRYLFF